MLVIVRLEKTLAKRTEHSELTLKQVYSLSVRQDSLHFAEYSRTVAELSSVPLFFHLCKSFFRYYESLVDKLIQLFSLFSASFRYVTIFLEWLVIDYDVKNIFEMRELWL